MYLKRKVISVDENVYETLKRLGHAGGVAFERQFIRAVKHLLVIQEYNMEVKPPIFIVLTIMNVRGYTFIESGTHTIDRDSLLIPEIMIETFPHNEHDIEKELKKILDIFWNAVGFPYSPNFDSTGKWIGHTKYLP